MAAAPDNDYERDGFFLSQPLLPNGLVARSVERMDAVMRGEFATGVQPMAMWKPGDDPTRIRKIDQAHLCDPTLLELVSNPAIGEWAAQITGAQWIQVWAVQMLYKPPGTSTAVQANIGWHQDWQYWEPWWEPGSDLFTAWVALSDVREESGPMRFAAGSQRWGFLNQGDFFNGRFDREKIAPPTGEEWREVPAILALGAASLHHRYTYHASGPNLSSAPRRSLAIHLRSENSAPRPGSDHYYVSHLDDPAMCPVIYHHQSQIV